MDTEDLIVSNAVIDLENEAEETNELFTETLMKAVAVAAAVAVTKIVVPLVVGKVTNAVKARRARKNAETAATEDPAA